MSEQVIVETSAGSFTIELDSEKAPNTVTNFLEYVDASHYDGTIFHRVIRDFMIQGGGFDTSYTKKAVRAPIRNEANNGLNNLRGTVSMARTSEPHSATAQFFVNTVDNDFLDYRTPSDSGWGYAVFGRVVQGMETVDAIREVATGSEGPFSENAPSTQVVIRSIRRA